MRAILRYVLGLPVLAVVSAVYQQNIQNLSQEIGTDKLLSNHLGAAMLWLSELARSPWFIFFAGVCFGAFITLWIDYLIRGNPPRAQQQRAPQDAITASSISHAFRPLDSMAVHVGVDKTKKNIQIGFNLKNSSANPLRYTVKTATSAVDGRTSMAQNFVNRGGVVAKDGTTRFLCVPIPYTLSKKGAEATASIEYQYGSAEPGEPPLREAIYAVSISIGPTGQSAYVFIEENDAEI